MTRINAFVAVSSAVVLFACSSETAPGPSLSLTTYNAGLAPGFVDYDGERAPHVMTALAAIESDLFCVQEFWQAADFDALVAAMATTHPHTQRLLPDPGMGISMCTMGELDAMEVCVMANCDMVPADMLASCATTNCSAEFGTLSGSCVNCLIANVGTGDLAMIRTTCETVGGSAYAYLGSFGTGMLSRYPLADTDSLVLDSSATRRAVLYARVTGTPIGDVHAFCTHLTAGLSAVPYPGMHGSWEGEQTQQIQAVLAFVESKTGGMGQTAILGDLNSGPDLPPIRSEFPTNYAMWLAAGFENTYPTQADVLCTYCDSNPLNLGTMGGDGGLIDHILTRGFAAGSQGQRILDAPLTIDVAGTPLMSAYSDHYGLTLQVRGP